MGPNGYVVVTPPAPPNPWVFQIWKHGVFTANFGPGHGYVGHTGLNPDPAPRIWRLRDFGLELN